jgi:hypothetical protein
VSRKIERTFEVAVTVEHVSNANGPHRTSALDVRED